MFSNREALAFIIAPWASPIVIIAAATIRSGGWPFHYEINIIVSHAIITSYAGLIIIGIPIFRILRRLGKLNLLTLIFVGGICGVLVFMVFSVLLSFALSSKSHLAFSISSILWGSILGTSVAVVYGLIAGVPMIKYKQ